MSKATESPPQPSHLMPIAEVSALYDLHPTTVYEHARTGKIPALRIGRSVRFVRAAIMRHFYQEVMPTP